MGEVGLVSLSAGVRGEWNPELFERFRRARPGSRKRRFLASMIIRQNEPLIIKLTSQLRGVAGDDGKAFAVRFRGRNFARVIESEKLEWEDALNAGRIAMAKALDRFDPSRGSMPNYLKKKIFYELQALVGKTGIVTVERGERAAPFTGFSDLEHMDRVLAEVAELEGEPGYMEPEHELALAEAEVLAAAFEATPFDTPPPPPPDTRTALEVLLDDHLHFAKHARCAETPVRGRHRRLAQLRGEDARRGALLEALRYRGARVTRVRVDWSDSPVDGFAGVSLQSTARPRSLQSTTATLPGASPEARGSSSSSYLPTGGYNGQTTREATPRGAAGVTARADQ